MLNVYKETSKAEDEGDLWIGRNVRTVRGNNNTAIIVKSIEYHIASYFSGRKIQRFGVKNQCFLFNPFLF